MYPLCANCEIEIRWKPTIVDGNRYCCAGCAEGGPCICDYAQLPRLDDGLRAIRSIRFEFYTES